jgi:hypothetical protein
MPVVPALRRQRQEDHELEARLGYTVTLSKNRKEKCLETVLKCYYSKLRYVLSVN